MQSFNWKMIRNGRAHVERVLSGTFGLNQGVQAKLTVIDEDGTSYSHTLGFEHTLSKALTLQSEERVSARVNGGHFFIANGEIVDFRPFSKRRQFVHTDEAIATLIEEVGVRFREVTTKDNGELHIIDHQWGRHALQPSAIDSLTAIAQKTRVRERILSDTISLSAFRDATDFEVPALGVNGHFLSVVGQIWSPFKPHVEFSMGLVHKATFSAMIGTKDELVQQFQIVNEWEHHLSIASQRFRDDVHRHIKNRFNLMQDSRASLELVNRAHDHAAKRTKPLDVTHPALPVCRRLLAILDSPYHLKDYYYDHAFKEARLRGALSSHLSVFDLWLCVVEMDAHLPELEGSRSVTVQQFANELLLATRKLHGVERMSEAVPTAPFMNNDNAFFGVLDTPR